ncbi:hypothetical protein [Microbulbifer yueqingensis]|uniref:Uncharacterized protein n=1 Tax=Microbulbifer yueqingensis TaxID=658219 RepID=A0A1G9AG04_9GAMM|nr:hypothetical protein [Microbulbifer yueqingensis]SDK25445.1 hypothetical protein SAMN05216212_1965 [Microbulbifer yueqingensis]
MKHFTCDHDAVSETGQHHLPAAEAWVRFLAHFLFVLAAWTVFIKYIFPAGYALAHGEPWHRYFYWDFWPVAHAWLGWALIARPRYTYLLAVTVAVVEIIIIVAKFAGFLADPTWSIWRTNWFVNKVFVLACFVLLLATAMLKPGCFKPRSNNGSNKDEETA